MILTIKIQIARIAGLLILVTLLVPGMKTAVAEENTLIMSMDSVREFGTDPTISDAALQGNGWQFHHYYTHFSPLIEQDINKKIIPWMAESFEISDDYTAIKFRLRKGIKFADGTPFNSSIAKFNFDRILGYGLRDETYQNLCAPVKYYDSSEALDEYTLRVQFTQGWLDIAIDLTNLQRYHGFISPWDVEPAWDTKGVLKPEKMYNGLGAYYVDENESLPNERIVLIKRHSWQDDLDFHVPKMKKIVLTQIADPETAIVALKKGEINFINRAYSPPLKSLTELENDPDITIQSRPSSQTYLIATAHWKEPFNGSDGILLRKAINYALDREEIAKSVFFGYAKPATNTMYLSPLLADLPECCYRGYSYNTDKARKILSDAGWKDVDGDGILDKNGKSLKGLDFAVSSGSNWMLDVALMIQSQLRKIGIDVKIQTLEPSLFYEATKNGNFDLQLDYTRPNPIAFQLKTFNSSTRYGHGIYANENGTLGRAIYESGLTTLKEKRDEYVCKVCNILYEDAGTIPLIHPTEYTVMSSKVKGYELLSSSGWGVYEHAEECWIE